VKGNFKTKLAMTADHRSRVRANEVLNRTFGPEKDEMKGTWRKLRNEESHNIYMSPNIVTIINSEG
jgi:hypothetical protein